jgi:hypothetical protein
MEQVLLVGSEQLSMVARDAIVRTFRNADVRVVRHSISEMNWGLFTGELGEADHILLILETSKDPSIAATKKKNVAEIVNVLHLSQESDIPDMCALFLDPKAAEEYGWLASETQEDKRHLRVAFAANSQTMSQLPNGCRSVLVNDLPRPCAALRLVAVTTGKHEFGNAT